MTDLPAADLVEARLKWTPLTYPQLAHEVYGVPVHVIPTMTPQERRERLTAIRKCQEAIEELRRRGKAVCSGSAGIWLTRDPDELMDQYRRLRRRAIHQLVNLRAMRRTARAMRGAQVEQFSWMDAA